MKAQTDQDFREPLKAGTVLHCEDGNYRISSENYCSGGSGIIYTSVEKEGEKLCYAVKECFPRPIKISGNWYSCKRKDGTICVEGADSKAGEKYLENIKALMTSEKEKGQEIFYAEDDIIPIRQQLIVQDEGLKENLYMLLDSFGRKGCTLEELLAYCRKPACKGYPLRNGDPASDVPAKPDIYATARITEKVLKLVKRMHDRGWIHGDLHPGNLIFINAGETGKTIDDCIGQVKLVDFACAKRIDGDGHILWDGNYDIYGTPGYTAPELTAGFDPKELPGRQLDIYSIGRMFYYLVTGETHLEDGRDMLQENSHLIDIGPYEVNGTNCRNEDEETAAGIIRRALAPDPESRYRNAEEMLTDIEKLIKNTRPPEYELTKHLEASRDFIRGSRDKEMSAIEQAFEEGNRQVWLNGFGGMGKSELAVEYANEYIRRKEGKAFLTSYADNMRKTILNLDFEGYWYDPQAIGHHGRDGKQQKEEQYRDKLGLLSAYHSNDLLIIDNFDSETISLTEMQDKAYHDLTTKDMRIIFTTRKEITGRGVVPVEALDRSFLRGIIREKYRGNDSDEEIDRLIDTVHGNTLAVRIMAGTMGDPLHGISYDEMLKAMTEESLDNGEFARVQNSRYEKGTRQYEELCLEDYFIRLYRVAKLNENEKRVMSCALLLSRQYGMDAKMFTKALGKSLENDLRLLIESSWIQCEKDKESNDAVIKLHPIIHEISMHQKELKPDEEKCGLFLNNLEKQNDKYLITKNEKSFQIAECYQNSFEMTKGSNSHYLYSAGGIYYYLGIFNKSMECYEKVFKICRCCVKKNDNKKNCGLLAEVMHNLGLVYDKQNRMDDAEKLYFKSLEIYKELEKRKAVYHRDVANSYYNLGYLYERQYRFDKAEEFLVKAIQLQRKLVRKEKTASYHELIVSYDALAVLKESQKQSEKAVDLLKKALQLQRDLVKGKENCNDYYLDLATICTNLAVFYDGRDRLKYSEPLFQEGQQIIRDLVMKNSLVYSPYLADMCMKYADFCDENNDLKKAKELYQESLQILRELTKNDPIVYNFDLAQICNNFGRFYYKQGQLEEAEGLYTEALQIQREFVKEHVGIYRDDYATSCNNLALLYEKQNRQKEAEDLYLKALQIRRELVKKNAVAYGPHLAICCSNLAGLYKTLGAVDKAKKLCCEAIDIFCRLNKTHPGTYDKSINNIDNLLKELDCEEPKK